MPTVHLTIKGKVQGVFYRASAKAKAEALGITGWVKNTEEGNVEAMVTGKQDELDEFIAWCRKGPSKARVTNVDVDDRPEKPFHQFSIERS